MATLNLPLYVRLGLWGIYTRKTALGFMWGCIAIGAASVAIGFYKPVFFFGSALWVSALWYLTAIRWVDHRGNWHTLPNE